MIKIGKSIGKETKITFVIGLAKIAMKANLSKANRIKTKKENENIGDII